MPSLLTSIELKKWLSYNPRTGLFVRTNKRFGCVIGSVAGGKNSKGYIYITVNGERYPATRLAWLYMTGKYITNFIDHKNRNVTDNRWKNLRIATNSQNRANSKTIGNSGLKGVYKVRYRWHAKIKYKGVLRYLGAFKTAKLAHSAYVKAAKVFHGEFARMK